MATAITQATFTHDVLEADKPVLVDFWAPWCGPCRMVSAVVDKLARDLEATHRVGKVNVDENPGLAEAYDVQTIPTLIVFKDGHPVGRLSGFRPEPQLREFLLAHSA